MLSEIVETTSAPDVMERLRILCSERGLETLADRLAELALLVTEDMTQLEAELEQIQSDASLASRAGSQLIGLGGKRLRPLCVALASRVGTGFSPQVLDLAVSVELVHNATLLHDDVIDLAPTRRGAPAARLQFGNAASIFAGDWLLIEALRRVHSAAVPGTFETLLETIDEMIRAESLQLEKRGCLDADRALYFEIAEGKSATLFRWAMLAGARAGGLDEAQTSALMSFGADMGIAFQVIDDLLDFAGDSQATGKALFTDLSEGKLTYPVIVGMERDPELRSVLVRLVEHSEPEAARNGGALADRTFVVKSLEASGALDECRAFAHARVERARSSLSTLPESEAVTALAMVADSIVYRDR